MAKAVRLAILALLAIPAAAVAQSANPPAVIVDAAADCWQATTPTSIDVGSLKKKGWVSAAFKDKDGKAVATPLRFFSKAGSSVMIMALPDGKAPACSVVSRVDGLAAYRPLMDQLQTRLKQIEATLKAGRAGTNGAAFLGGGRMALVEPTGTKEQPSVRFSVTASATTKSGN